MKTIRKIWEELYSNWLLVTIGIILFAHYCLGSSWTWLWLPVVMFIVATISIYFSNEFFVPIRIIIWPTIRLHLIKKIKMTGGDILSYPMIIWVELEGRRPFIRGGWSELIDAMTKHLDKTAHDFESGLDKIIADVESMNES